MIVEEIIHCGRRIALIHRHGKSCYSLEWSDPYGKFNQGYFQAKRRLAYWKNK